MRLLRDVWHFFTDSADLILLTVLVVTIGGLPSYGIDPIDLNLRATDYVDRILRDAKPGDLPIEQPTKFELVVNLKTAKALGLTIPESFLLRADEIIK